MKKVLKKAIALAMLVGLTYSSQAQKSQGGSPFSFANAVQTKSSLQKEVLQKPDVSALAVVDAQNASKDIPYRVGLNIPVNYNTINSGTWQTTPNGGSLWRLRIEVKDALALGLYYHNFFIPTGGKVFIYNESENHVIGAFTDANNFQDQIRATQMIEGDIITVEYYAPPGVTTTPVIEIKEVVYFYRGVEDFIAPIIEDASGVDILQNKAQSCEIDVACSPENSGKADQINAAVHYSFSTGGGTAVCSGSMLNNTSQDCTPYIFSAWHCGEPTVSSNMSSYVFYWNYQKASCSPGTANGTDPGPGTETMTGGTVVASSGNGTSNNPPGTNQLAGSDFFLLQLQSQPPTSYNAFLAGWDRSNTASTSGYGIHHPAGSAKKISTYTSSLNSATYNGGATNAHWEVQWSATANGHGVTEGGSSGSPIFNANGRVVGQLSGGSSFCNATSQTDLYGKLFYDWDQCGTAIIAQLKPFLDPGNTGVMFMDGAYQPCTSSSPPTCGINASTMTVTAGGSVSFSDNSTGSPTSWAWNFDNTNLGGVAPSTATVQNPAAVTFSTVGLYEVELIATNANGSCTTTVNINVQASTGCDTLLNIADTNSLTVYAAGNGGFITGVNGFGDIAKAEKYSGYAPYTFVNGADVFFIGVQDGGNGSTVDLTLWSDNTGLPNTIVAQASYSLSQIESIVTANSGNALLYLAFNSPVNVAGNDFYIGLDFSNLGAGDTIGIVSKFESVAIPANSAYEQWSDNTWHDMSSSWGGGDWSLYIAPHVTDQPVSGSISGVTTACTNTPISLTATSINGDGTFDWFAPNGTLTNDSLATTDVTYTAPGNYTVYAYINGSCSGSILDSIQLTINGGPTLAVTPTDPTCAGNDGALNITATGATTPYTYSIDGGTTTQSNGMFSGLVGGTYNIVVTDASGCSSLDVATLTSAAGGLTVTTNTTDPSCGAADGQIDVISSGGATPYTYSIDGGTTFQSSSTFTGLNIGTFNIVVADASGCQGFASASLTNPNSPTLIATATNITCFGANDGTITANASGGSPTYNYSLDGVNYAPVSTISNLPAGNYTVYVQDAGSCQSTASVVIMEPSQVTHTATSIDAACGNANGSISVVAAGGTSPYTYTLDGGTPQSSGTFTGLASGSYNVVAIDGSGCTSATSVETVSGVSAPTLSVAANNETCMSGNGSLIVSASGGVAPLTYSIDGGVTFQSSQTFNGLSAGSYSVVVADATGCQSNTTSSITNSGGFTLNTSADQTICLGNSATIIASGAGFGATYVWDNGLPASAANTVSPTITTVYTVVATDAQSCTATASVTISVESIPTVSVVPANPSICAGDPVTLVASGAQTYVWNTGSTSANLTVTPNSQTTYTVIGQNGACSGTPVQTTVAVAPSPTVIATSDVYTISVGGTVNFSNAGSSATGFVWTFGDGNVSTQGIVAHTYNVMGVYTAVLTGTIGNCTATDTIIVNVGVVGVEAISLEEAITVYPNPNNGQFNLKIDLASGENIEVVVYSTIGQVISTRNVDNVQNSTLNFDLSNEAEGIYVVSIKTATATVVKRVTLVK